MKSLSPLLSSKTEFDPFAGPQIAMVVRTTQAQKEIWIACELGGEDANRAYNESISLILKGALKQGAMEQALQNLVGRHESLRAIFSTDGRFMSIFEQLPTKLFFKDISNFPATEKENFIQAYLRADANHLFDLVEGPLLKAGLLKISESEYQLVLTAHHIICDGWSLGIILQELGMLYSAYAQNRCPNLPESSSFSAYADSNQALIESDEYQKIEQFWLDQYEHSIPELDLPTDYPRPSIRTYESQRLNFPIEADIFAALKKTGLQVGCSFVTTLLGVFEVFLYQLTGQDNLVVGLPAAGQSVARNPHLVGHCANLLPLRSTIKANISFNEYIKQRKSALLDAYDHQQLSFGHLLKKLNISRDPSRVPLVPVVFNVDIGLTNGVAFEGHSYTLKSNPRIYEIFEIFVNVSGSEDKLVLEWSYNTALFQPETIKQMMGAFEQILHRIVAEPDGLISQITETKHTAYLDLNNTNVNYPESPLNELLAEQAVATPHRIALKFYDTKISYKELQAQANRLANYLYEKGVRPNDLVGICLPRSSEMFITLLAIMKCGAAYLPMDPEYPQERLQFMLQDSEAKFLMMANKFSNSLSVANRSFILEEVFSKIKEYPNTPPALQISQEAVIYFLYTSGSTGKPKGVRVTHRNLINLLFSIANEPGITRNDKLLAITTISFDIAGVELYLPLLKGACVVMANTETARDSRLLLELIEKEEISILQATPSTWQMLMDANWKSPLKLKAFCGGEALSPNLAGRILSKCESLWNMYGPTETTIYSTLKHILTADAPICIGRPIANTQLYILNEQDQLLPPGAIGEIVIGGDGVSKGYWKRPELNAEKFVADVFSEDSDNTFYRTGDLGRLLPMGEVQCLGRLDEQIKVRGRRIEPGEIEQVLMNLEEIKAAALLARDNRLIAFVVPEKSVSEAGEQINRWRTSLVRSLPTYLVPSEFRVLKALPTTANGKLDRQALLSFPIPKDTDPTPHVGPRTETEKIIAIIWQDCLGINKVDIFSNFFELGGHSLLAVQVMCRLEQETGIRFPIAALFEYPTIKKLATFIDSEDGMFITGDTLLPIRPTGSKTPLYLIHGIGYNILKMNSLTKNLDREQPVYGLQGTGVKANGESLESVEEIAAHYIEAIRKVNPEGPYSFAGHSYGGIIAYEMASQLIGEGKKIKRLIMLDTDVELAYFYKSAFRKKLAILENTARRMFFTFNQMSKNWGNFKFYLNRKKDKLLKKYIILEDGRTKEQQLIDRHIAKLERKNNALMSKYNILPQQIEIDLLRAEKKNYFLHDPLYLGWKHLALNGLNVHDVPGDHLEMISPPNDEVAAHILQNILDRQSTNG